MDKQICKAEKGTDLCSEGVGRNNQKQRSVSNIAFAHEEWPYLYIKIP